MPRRVAQQRTVKLLAVVSAGLAASAAVAFGLRARQAPSRAEGVAQYVALGSSYAAGLGLGPRAPGSLMMCGRSLNGYPQQLARLRRVALVNMTCSGAKTGDILKRGQWFLRPQLDGLRPETELVTLTIGGNDVGYIGDLFMASLGGKPGLMGAVARRIRKAPSPASQRDWTKLRGHLSVVLAEIKHRSPHAQIVVVTYPTVLPPTGTCPRLGIDATTATVARAVGDRLAEETRGAAAEANVMVVDMHALGVDHHACSEHPWINGGMEVQGAAFHPTLEGATATAEAISRALDAAV